MAYESCLAKQKKVIDDFAVCQTVEDRYQKLIDLGRRQLHLDPCFKTSANQVHGCQSTMFLVSSYQDGLVHFAAESDALISAGLAAILLAVYSGEPPEAILKCPPDYLEELGISASISPNRANGLYSIHLRMKQDALKWILGSV